MPSAANPIVCEVTRGDKVESLHRGALVVCDSEKIVEGQGDYHADVFCRSAMKPLQALPLLESGAAARFDLSDADLALACASHSGTTAHVEGVRRLLARGGFAENHLLCGVQAPADSESNKALLRAGGEPNKLHNNCSGKHAGFLLLGKHLGEEPSAHLSPEGLAQTQVRAAVAQMAGLKDADLYGAVDGCGAPTFAFPLWTLARAFARLGTPAGLPEPRQIACRRLLQAVTAEPVLYSGPRRLVGALIQSAPGKIFPKNGAEGVFALSLPSMGLGVAVKIDDGSDRAVGPVVIALLHRLGLWNKVPESLATFAEPAVKNTQGLGVGVIRAIRAVPVSE